jgi:hypothetical protein
MDWSACSLCKYHNPRVSDPPCVQSLDDVGLVNNGRMILCRDFCLAVPLVARDGKSRVNFIETLKSVGGVTPCDCCNVDSAVLYIPLCSVCHNTGHLLDLTPLLANTGELTDVTNELLKMAGFVPAVCEKCHEVWLKPFVPIVVVGPQRASNIVYEVARQLGGTAVVSFDTGETVSDFTERASYFLKSDGHARNLKPPKQNYRLSLPIPDNATVLFVTDWLDVSEMKSIAECVKANVLPYLLCLVTDHSREGVIALHYDEEEK